MQAILKGFKVVLNCQCELGPIVRFINFKVLDGFNTVFLDEYKDKLLNSAKLNKLNDCLKSMDLMDM